MTTNRWTRGLVASLLMAASVARASQQGWQSTPDSRLPLSSRSYVASTLLEVFGPSARPVVDALITRQIAAFGGGPCDPYTENCPPGLSQLPVVPSGNTLRLSLVIRACQRLTSQDAAVRAAVRNATGNDAVAAPGPAKLAKLFDLFYTGRTASGEVMVSLAAVAEAAARGGQPLDAWRFPLAVICESPGWQVP